MKIKQLLVLLLLLPYLATMAQEKRKWKRYSSEQTKNEKRKYDMMKRNERFSMIHYSISNEQLNYGGKVCEIGTVPLSGIL